MKKNSARERCSIGLFFLMAFLLIFSRSMSLPLSHDEHLYVASGKLLAAYGMIPYRDYPYIHMPYLVFGYGLLFAVFDHILLAARLCSSFFAWLAVVIIYLFGSVTIRGMEATKARVFFSLAVASLLLFNPLFAFTSGWAWNHAVSTLLALVALWFHLQRLRQSPNRWNLVWSGVFLGLAIGVRLSFAPLALPFAVSLLVLPGPEGTPRGSGLKSCMLWVGGLIVALLPALLLGLAYPEAFLFGNFGWRTLDRLLSIELGQMETVGLLNKLLYFVRVTASGPGTVVLVAVFGLVWFLSLRCWVRNSTAAPVELSFISSIIVFLAPALFAATPSNPQYLYPVMPFLLIGVIRGLGWLRDHHRSYSIVGSRGTVVAAIVASVFGIPQYRWLPQVLSPTTWTPLEVHNVGVEIAGVVGTAKVLTTAPIYPLEGGADICAPLTTGSFTWRTGHLQSKDVRARLNVASEADVSDLVGRYQPWILTGSERPDAERSLDRYAKEHGWRSVQLRSKDMTLYAPR